MMKEDSSILIITLRSLSSLVTTCPKAYDRTNGLQGFEESVTAVTGLKSTVGEGICLSR